MFMVLSSWRGHCQSSPGSFDECMQRQPYANSQTEAAFYIDNQTAVLDDSLVHGQLTIIFVVSVCLSVQNFSQPSLIRFRSN